MRRAVGPLLHDEVLAHVQAARAELDVGPRLEDAPDVLERLLALGALAGGVVLEDHVRSVHRADALDVVGVPGVVVRVDRLAQRIRGRVRAAGGHAHDIGSKPLDTGAETMSTLAASSPSLRTVRACSGSRRANVPARAGWSSPSITSVGLPDRTRKHSS